MSHEPTAGGSGSVASVPGAWRVLALFAALALLAVAAVSVDLGAQIAATRDWIRGLGPWGPVVFVGLYAAAVVAALPGAAITLAGGALFGAGAGLALVSLGSTLGAALAFLIARYAARDAVAAWLGRHERFARLDAMTATHGALIVALTRLVPLFPFNLLNYAFGLTRVPFWTYVFWSWLCMLPGTALFVVGADGLAAGITEGRVPWLHVAGVLVLALLVTLIARRARRQLAETPENPGG